MPEMTDALIGNAASLANQASGGTVANLVDGSQLGFGNLLPSIDAATPLVLRPLVPIVTHAPTMFQLLDNANGGGGYGYVPTLKALIERHAKSIEGVDLQYTMEGGATPAGQDGQELYVPTNAKRTPVNPQFIFQEVTGNLVWNFFKYWMNLAKNPDTQASSLAGVVPGNATLPPHVLSMFSMDLLFIQYDTTMRPENVIDGYFITSMWPSDIGPAGFKKQIGESAVADRNITFYGVLQHNANTKAVAQQIASLLQLHLIDYNYAVPITTQMDSNLLDEGLQAEAQQALATFTQVP